MHGYRRNLDDMLRVSWHLAIFDEAHKLKNRSAKIYDACCQLPTKLRYGLTGTAMQVGSSQGTVFTESFRNKPASETGTLTLIRCVMQKTLQHSKIG